MRFFAAAFFFAAMRISHYQIRKCFRASVHLRHEGGFDDRGTFLTKPVRRSLTRSARHPTAEDLTDYVGFAAAHAKKAVCGTAAAIAFVSATPSADVSAPGLNVGAGFAFHVASKVFL